MDPEQEPTKAPERLRVSTMGRVRRDSVPAPAKGDDKKEPRAPAPLAGPRFWPSVVPDARIVGAIKADILDFLSR